jgi:ATP synthase protein I
MIKIKKPDSGLKQVSEDDNYQSYHQYEKKMSKINVMQELAPYASLGLQLVITIIIFAYAGWWIDGKFDTRPWFLIILTFLGAIAGMVTFIRTVTRKNIKNKS